MDEHKKWKVLSSEYLGKEPWFTVRKEKVQLPSGHIIPSYYILEYPNWVNVIGITKEKQFVIISQYRHGTGKVGYELSAGVCDATDASPMESAKRELLEETGYGNGNWKEWMVISANTSTHTNYTYCYLATDIEVVSPQNQEASEDISVHLFNEEEVYELLQKDAFEQSLHAAPLWKYFAMKK